MFSNPFVMNCSFHKPVLMDHKNSYHYSIRNITNKHVPLLYAEPSLESKRTNPWHHRMSLRMPSAFIGVFIGVYSTA